MRKETVKILKKVFKEVENKKLQEIIIKSNPKIRTYENRCYTCGYGFSHCKCSPKRTEWYRDREITLANVLITLDEKKIDMFINRVGGFVRYEFGMKKPIHTNINWNLQENNLHNQSDELKNWLYKLLK